MLVCGIDEAGRGPVIGPLVMAGATISEDKLKKLEILGVQDSKILTRKRREELFKELLMLLDGYKIISVSNETIDEHLNDEKSNLNILEAYTTTEIINILAPDEVFIDLPDRNKDRYESHVRKNMESQKVKLISEHKADAKYPIVSAASILAKVTRDRYIDMLKEKIGMDFGSGYPADPKTKIFLENNWDNVNINFFRKTWEPYKQAKIKKEQRSLFDF